GAGGGAAADGRPDAAEARHAFGVARGGGAREGEADVEEGRAIELWEAKGATLLAERARQRYGRAAASRGAPVLDAPIAPQAQRFGNVVCRLQADLERRWQERGWGGSVAAPWPAP